MYIHNTRHFLEELVLSVLLLLKEYIRLGHACILEHSLKCIGTTLKKRKIITKGMDRRRRRRRRRKREEEERKNTNNNVVQSYNGKTSDTYQLLSIIS